LISEPTELPENYKRMVADYFLILVTGTLKDQGRELGTLAVTACARCHGTHRLAYDSRNQLVEKQAGES